MHFSPLQHFVPENINKKILENIMSLPDKVRKEVRLLAKQYEIIEVFQDSADSVEYTNKAIKKQPFIIRYRNFGCHGEQFEWIIDD